MIAYLKLLVSGSDEATVHRFVVVLAAVCLGVSTIALSAAACAGQEVSVALATVTAPLATMAGYAYGKGKQAEIAAARGADAAT